VFPVQVHFEHVTGNTLHIKGWHKAVIILTVVIPLFTTVSIVVDWLVMPEFKLSEIYCYCYTNILVHLHIGLWFTMCCIVASTAQHLMDMLQKVKALILCHNCTNLPQNKDQEVNGNSISCICSFRYLYLYSKASKNHMLHNSLYIISTITNSG
jgi:hypothetical protein